MLQAYVDHVAERAALGIPPLPLTAKQTSEMIELLKTAQPGEEGEFLLNLLSHRVPAGVDDAAKVKASYLAAIAFGARLDLDRDALAGREDVAGAEGVAGDGVFHRRDQHPQPARAA